MKLSKGDLVLANEGDRYYNVGVISDITDEEVYILLFNTDGKLSKYSTRHCLFGESVRRTTICNAIDILVKDSKKLITNNLSLLKTEGIIKNKE